LFVAERPVANISCIVMTTTIQVQHYQTILILEWDNDHWPPLEKYGELGRDE